MTNRCNYGKATNQCFKKNILAMKVMVQALIHTFYPFLGYCEVGIRQSFLVFTHTKSPFNIRKCYITIWHFIGISFYLVGTKVVHQSR